MDPTKLRPDLIETICIDDFTQRKEFGRERGSHDVVLSARFCAELLLPVCPGWNPSPTEAQKAAVAKLHTQLQVKLRSKSRKEVKEVTETEIQFDLMARTRVILWRGNVLKKRTNTLYHRYFHD